VRTLSGGEFQRVMLARAIARKPDLLVLDEPVQGVDFTGEIELYNLIQQIRDDLHCGILLISHDLHVVMAATDRVICLNGHVCCSGTPTVVASSAEYKALFGARAASTLAVYEHHHDHTHLPDGRVRHGDGSITDHCHPEDGHHHHHSGPMITQVMEKSRCLTTSSPALFLPALVLRLVAGPLGCFIVWRRLAYFGDTLSHAALLGVALAFLFEINITLAVFASPPVCRSHCLLLQSAPRFHPTRCWACWPIPPWRWAWLCLPS
jgi:hypothetical protein